MMAKYVCPCCGSPFNGRKCRSCLYETFDEEISHSLHTHKGEPLVIDTPTRQPIPRHDPFACDKKLLPRGQFQPQSRQSRKKKKLPKIVIWLLVFMLAEPLLALVGVVVEQIGDAFSSSRIVSREPEPAPEPEPALTEEYKPIYAKDGLTLYLGKTEDGFDFPLILENTTDGDVVLSAEQIVADDYLTERSYAHCIAPAGKRMAGWLRLDQEDLAYGCGGIPAQVMLSFHIYDSESYEDVLTGEVLIPGTGTAQPVTPEYQPLVDTGEFIVGLIGYAPDSYSPEVFSEGSILFYMENRSDRPLTIYSLQAKLAGEEISFYLWEKLPAGKRTVSRMWLYEAEDLDIQTLEDAGDLELRLTIEDAAAGSVMDLGWVSIPLQ